MTGIAATRIGVVADDDVLVNPSMLIGGTGTGRRDSSHPNRSRRRRRYLG